MGFVESEGRGCCTPETRDVKGNTDRFTTLITTNSSTDDASVRHLKRKQPVRRNPSGAWG